MLAEEISDREADKPYQVFVECLTTDLCDKYFYYVAVGSRQYLRTTLTFLKRVAELYEADLTEDYYEVKVTLVDPVGLKTETMFQVEVTLGATKPKRTQ